jgi:hypothetical protein
MYSFQPHHESRKDQIHVVLRHVDQMRCAQIEMELLHANVFKDTLAIHMLHVDLSAQLMQNVLQTKLVRIKNVSTHAPDYAVLMRIAELSTISPLAHAMKDISEIHFRLVD